MEKIFFKAVNFNQDLSSWNAGAVTNMDCMFYGAANFNQVSCWDTNELTSAHGMLEQSPGSFDPSCS